MTVGSSVEEICPLSRRKDVVEACGDAFGTGETIPQCEASDGGPSSTSAICSAYVRARLNRVGQPIRAHTVINQPKPLRPLLLLIVRKHAPGDRGSAVPILTVCGMERGITQLPSILPGLAWPFSSPIMKQSGTWRTAWRIRPSSLRCIAAQARRCCCRRKALSPARMRANTFTMPVGLMQHHYAHLVRKISLLYFLRLNLGSTCFNMRNVRIVSCFCNGSHTSSASTPPTGPWRTCSTINLFCLGKA